MSPVSILEDPRLARLNRVVDGLIDALREAEERRDEAVARELAIALSRVAIARAILRMSTERGSA